MSESQYLIQQVLGEAERVENKSVSEWFNERQKWLKANSDSYLVFTPPESRRVVDVHCKSKILTVGRSRAVLGQHSKEKGYKDDRDFLSLTIEEGLGTERKREQFVVLKDENIFRWFWREKDDPQWRELSQNKVPLYAIFSITENIK